MAHKNSNRRNWLISLAATLALASTSSMLQAQYRTGSDGHARDANNRVGSSGYNGGGAGSSSPYANNGNQIGNNVVTGNITGGREFRGFVPYTAAGAFSTQLSSSNVDNFISGSAGVPIGTYNNNNAQNVLPYWGQSQGAPPPTGFSSTPTFNGQYLPSLPASREAGDLRLGNPFSAPLIQQPGPGQTVLPGPVDPQAPTVITASPLYGVRQWRMNDQNDAEFLHNYTDAFNNGRSNRLRDVSLDQMRNELDKQEGEEFNPNAPQTDNGTSTGGGQRELNKPLDKPFDASNPEIQNKPLSNAATNDALTGSTRTGETSGSRNMRATSRLANSSPAYRELKARMEQYKVGGDLNAEVEANRERQAENRRLLAIEKANGKTDTTNGQPAQPGMQQPGAQQPGALPPGLQQPGVPQPGIQPGATPNAQPGAIPSVTDTPTPTDTKLTPTPRTKPLQINSFAKDMKQSGAANLMREAETEMRGGKFTRALDKYDMVDQVATDDPLVSLGRATAELGASYYTRADAHLRDAFTRNQELLMGQYDLHALLGDERLQILVTDLKDLATKNKNDSRYPFLLAYIAYNTGNEKNASAYLDLADKRTGGRDPFFKLIRSRWSLPDDAAPQTATPPTTQPEMNK